MKSYNILETLKKFINSEREEFLFDCYLYKKDPEDYSSTDEWCIEAIKNLWRYRVMDSHGFSIGDLTEIEEKQGDVILFSYPDVKDDSLHSIKLRTLLNFNLRY